MKKYLLFSCLFNLSIIISAQTQEEIKYALTNESATYGFSLLELLDPYLSPLTYTGLGLSYEKSSQKFLNPENSNLSKLGKFTVHVGMTLNPLYSASMNYMSGDYTWGMYYHYRPLKNIQLLIGGNVNGELGIKSNTRNVNNPFNIDIATNINLSSVLRYDIVLKRRVLRLNYSFDIPLIGCMFVPQGGSSYYEMLEFGNLSNAIHFSSLHNKIGFSNNFFLSIPFNNSTWRIGFSTTKLTYEANNLVFDRNIFNVNIGYIFDVQYFKGMKHSAPSNFIDSNK